jgi:hypothetical protein
VDALHAWVQSGVPFQHQVVTHPVANATNPNVPRSGNDEYPISAGWFGYHATSRFRPLYKDRLVAQNSLREHVNSDTTYCTDERWLYKAAGLFFGLGNWNKNRRTWERTGAMITPIPEIRDPWPWSLEASHGNNHNHAQDEYRAMLRALPHHTNSAPRPRAIADPWQ